MDNFNNWKKQQQGIYDKNFKGKKDLVAKEGVKSGFEGITGGYYLVFKYNNEVSEKLKDLSSLVNKCFPDGSSMLYPQRIIHATLSDYAISPINEFSRNEEILKKLTAGIL